MLAFPWMPWYSWNIAKVGVKQQSIIPVTQFQPVWPFANSYKMRSTYIAAGNSHHTLDQFDGIRKLLISACVYENETKMTTWKRYRNGGKRFGALKSDSTHHFFSNTCTKSGSLRFSQFSGCWLILSVYILMSFYFPIVRLFGVR